MKDRGEMKVEMCRICGEAEVEWDCAYCGWELCSGCGPIHEEDCEEDYGE